MKTDNIQPGQLCRVITECEWFTDRRVALDDVPMGAIFMFLGRIGSNGYGEDWLYKDVIIRTHRFMLCDKYLEKV